MRRNAANRLIRRPRGDFLLGNNLNTGQKIYVPKSFWPTGVWILGPPGQGKSFAMLAMIKQAIAQQFPCLVLDRHGDLVKNVQKCVSLQPGLAKRVVVFDPKEAVNILTLDLMRMLPGQLRSAKVAYLVEGIRRYMGEGAQQVPRVTRWLSNIFEALLMADCSFTEAEHLVDIVDNQLRTAIIQAAGTDYGPALRQWEWFEKLKVPERANQIESSLNRIQAFLSNDRISMMLGSRQHGLDWEDVLQHNKIVLFDVSQQGYLSSEDCDMLSTLVLHDLISFVRSKGEADRKGIFLFCDEYHRYASRLTADSHTEDRKFGLQWCVANQLPSQLMHPDPYILKNVYGGLQTKIVFGGLNWDEVEILEKDFYAGQHNLELIKDEIKQRKVVDYLEQKRIVESGSAGISQVKNFFSSQSETITEGRSRSQGRSSTSGSMRAITINPGDGFMGIGHVPSAIRHGHNNGTSETETETQSSSNSRSTSSGEGQADGVTENKGWAETIIQKPVFGEEVSSREFWSLDEQRYKNCASMINLSKQHATVKIGVLPAFQVKIARVRIPPVTQVRLDRFRQKMFALHPCYMPVAVIEAEKAQRHRLLLNGGINCDDIEDIDYGE